MKRYSHYLLTRHRAVLSAVIVSTLAIGAYTAIRTKGMGFLLKSKSIETSSLSSDEAVEVELLTILPSGFEPRELVRPAGRFVLMFDNQSGLQPLEFHIEGIGVPRVAEVRLARKNDSTRILNLPSGQYQITEATHPEWSLLLTLTKR